MTRVKFEKDIDPAILAERIEALTVLMAEILHRMPADQADAIIAQWVPQGGGNRAYRQTFESLADILRERRNGTFDR